MHDYTRRALAAVTTVAAVGLVTDLAGCTPATRTTSTTSTARPAPLAASSAPKPTTTAPTPKPPAGQTTTQPGDYSREEAVAALARLVDVIPKRPQVPGYARDRFGPGLTESGSDAAPGKWQGNGCRTLDDVRAAQLGHLVSKRKGRCAVVPTAGTKVDPYTGKTVAWSSAKPAALQADHVRALSDAWDFGADKWTQDKRAAFANDPLNLELVTGSVNSGKGDRTPSEWAPASRDGACWYARRYVRVSAVYELPVSESDASALRSILTDACRS